jgi:hypothetical protein
MRLFSGAWSISQVRSAPVLKLDGGMDIQLKLQMIWERRLWIARRRPRLGFDNLHQDGCDIALNDY